MKMPPPIATKFTKLVLTILAITILGIILSFVSQDHTLLMLSAGVAVAGGVKIIDYCEEHRGYIQDSEGLWGYTYNPNAKWDWWQIGGRFSRNFLVKEDLEDCIISYDRSSGEPDGAPKGYKYVDAARKKDICWDLMKQLTVEEVEKGYQKCVAAFASNDPTGFGPLTKIVEDGIASWGSMIYLKGETLDEFKARKGATDMDQYMISSFAAIDRNGDWLGSGDMGWFGISTNDKEERAWNDELQTLMNEAQDDDFLVVVDCHI